MRGFKLLLCSLLVGLFGILSFSSANNWFENLSAYKVSSISYSDDFIIRTPSTVYCVYISGLKSSISYSFSVNNEAWGPCGNLSFAVPSGNTDFNYCFTSFSCNDSAMGSQGLQVLPTDHFPMSVYKFNVSNTPINIVSDCSQDSNYLQCLEDKNQLIGQVSTLSGSLTTCQSDLSSCRSGQDASLLACIDQKEQCETNLSTLSGNYESLSNMNTSLSEQLLECLETSNMTGDLLCNKFDLIWSSENTNYSFPINNDLFLPSGYKGFVNEGVLAIKQDTSLTSAYSVSDEDFQEVMNSYGVLLLYLFGCGLFLVFLYMIRKYFIGLKS